MVILQLFDDDGKFLVYFHGFCFTSPHCCVTCRVTDQIAPAISPSRTISSMDIDTLRAATQTRADRFAHDVGRFLGLNYDWQWDKTEDGKPYLTICATDGHAYSPSWLVEQAESGLWDLTAGAEMVVTGAATPASALLLSASD
jgi:hypothetical protein